MVVRGEGAVRDFGMDMYTLVYLKWIANKDLLYSTWNLLNVMAGPNGTGAWGRMDTWACMANPSAVHLKLSQHCSLVKSSNTQNIPSLQMRKLWH